jgi:hypothetical protein
MSKIVKNKLNEKETNPQEAITLSEAMELLKGKSDISKSCIRSASIRDGFRIECKTKQGKQQKNYIIDKEKFIKWIADTIDIIPQGFVVVAKCARDLAISNTYVYMLIDKYKITTKKGGAGKGKLYVDFAELKKALNGNKNVGENK